MAANVKKKNSLWGEKTKPHCCVVLILLLMLRREHDVNSEAAPPGTQTNKPERSNSTNGKVPNPSLWADGHETGFIYC